MDVPSSSPQKGGKRGGEETSIVSTGSVVYKKAPTFCKERLGENRRGGRILFRREPMMLSRVGWIQVACGAREGPAPALGAG